MEGVEDFGFGILLQNKQIKRAICSGIGENNELGRQYMSGEIELEFVPQVRIVLLESYLPY